MKKLLFVLTMLFSALCFVGGAYVLLYRGQVNAGYAVIPCVFCAACLNGYLAIRRVEETEEPPEAEEQT